MPISLGSITFGIGPDTTRLRASIGDITNFGQAVENAARLTNGAATGATAALLRQEAAAISALSKVQAFQDKVGKLSAPANLSGGLNQLSTQGLDRFVARMTSGQLTAIQFQREMERFNVTMANSNRIAGQWAVAQKQVAAGSAIASLQQLSSAATLVYGPLSGVATRFSVAASLADHFSLATAGLVVGLAAGAYAFAKFASSAIEVEKKMQSTEQTFQAVTGSQVIAATQIKYLGDFADKAGVKFDDLSKNYGQLQAAAKGTNLEGERTNKIFEGITMAAGKLGLSADDTKGSLLAIQQIITKGTVQMEELKSQLGDRMPGALKAYADSLGVTTTKFSEMVQKGQVGASTLVGFVEALKKRYSIDENTKIDTITAAENRLYNARTRMIDSLDKVVGLSSAYTNVLNYLSNGINGASTRAAELVTVVLQVGAGLTAAFAGQAMIGGLSMLVTGIINLGAAITAVNAVTAAGAFTSFVRLLSVAALAVAGFYGSKALIQEMMEGSKQSFLNATPPVQAYIKEMLALTEATNSVRAPTIKYIDDEMAKLDQLKTKREELATKIAAPLGMMELVEGMANAEEQIKNIAKDSGLPELEKQFYANEKAIDATNKRLEQLKGILTQQTIVEAANRDDPLKALNDRQLLSLKGAQDTIAETQRAFANLGKDPGARDWANTQNEISKQIENFRDGLTKSQLPLEMVTKLTLEFGSALRGLKEGQAIIDSSKLMNDAIDKGMASTKELQDRYKNLYKQPEAKELANAQIDINKNVAAYRAELEKAQVPEQMIVDLTGQRLVAMKKLTEGQIKLEYSTSTTRQITAMKNANDTVKELTQTYNNLYLAPGAKEYADLQNSINKQVENFRDTLTKTEIPVAKVTELTNNYAAALKKTKEAELTLSHTTSYFQAIEGIFSRGIDKGLDAWISVIMEGKDAMEALKDTAKAVVADIFKTFMTLAALNPLKNALFGTNYQTLGGSAGVGGLLGNIFGGGGSSGALPGMPGSAQFGPVAPFAMGGIMTPSGAKPLNHYANGGIARGSQFAEFGEGRKPEAYVPLPDGRSIPVSMEGASGGMAVHIHEAAGVKAQVSYGNHNGDDGMHVMLKKVSTGALMEDIASGGAFSRQMEKQYGLRRTTGMAS